MGGGGEQWLDLVVHHLFVGVVLCEHAEEFNDVGVLHKASVIKAFTED
jgi:hypothetical protein